MTRQTTAALLLAVSASLSACAPADDGTTTADDDLAQACAPTPACVGTTGPTLPNRAGFDHLSTKLTRLGKPTHRGRDQIYVAGRAQWIIGKFSYSVLDKDLEDERVDVYVERGCAGAWQKVGTGRTSDERRRGRVEGVEDEGGRFFFEIPPEQALGIGRHRVRLVVAGDNSSTDLLVDVVPKDTKIVVTDVDGTLTSSEMAELPALLEGELPQAQLGAAEALSALSSKGYRVVYLTSRPEWLTGRTKEFVVERGFPRGIVHTTPTMTGAFGKTAADYKSAELRRLVDQGLSVAWTFGNKPTDGEAFDAIGLAPDRRILLGTDDTHGGRRIGSYAEIMPSIEASERACR